MSIFVSNFFKNLHVVAMDNSLQTDVKSGIRVDSPTSPTLVRTIFPEKRACPSAHLSASVEGGKHVESRGKHGCFSGLGYSSFYDFQ